MAAPSTSRLVTALNDSTLLPADQRAQLPELLQNCSEPRALAREVVARGWLTPFQMDVLLRGTAEDLIVGPYVLLGMVGEGAMGQVFKARHQKGGHLVALKVIREHHQEDAKVLKRFRREIRALTRLSHPNIITARDIKDIDRTRYFAMEYFEGVNLDDVISETGALPLAPAVDYIRQAAMGLQHAYEKGLIHRDIKPANFFITPPTSTGKKGRAGHWGVVKILDLGLALLQMKPGERSDSHCRLTAKGNMLGTVDYVAPEQVMAAHEVDIRADLYSLGCTFYHILTGQVPFPHTSPAKKLLCHQEAEPLPVEQIRPTIPPEIARVVRKLMAKSPSERFQTPAHLAGAMLTILNTLEPEMVDLDWRLPHLEDCASTNRSHLTHRDTWPWWPVAIGAAALVVGTAALVFLL